MKIKSFYIVLVFLLVSPLLKAQHQKDAALWFGLSVEKKINPRFSVTFLNQSSLNQNLTEVGYTFFDFGLGYKLNSYFTVSGNYRFAKTRNLDNYYNDIQRFYADLTFSKGIRKFYFQFRTRIQTQIYGMDLFDSFRPNKNMSRNKIIVRYNINRIYSIYGFAEQFYRFNMANKVDAYRTGLGLTYKFNLKHRVDIFYLNQFQMNKKNTRTDFITGVTYSIKF